MGRHDRVPSQERRCRGFGPIGSSARPGATTAKKPRCPTTRLEECRPCGLTAPKGARGVATYFRAAHTFDERVPPVPRPRSEACGSDGNSPRPLAANRHAGADRQKIV